MINTIRKRIRNASVLLFIAFTAAALLSGCGEDEGIYRYGSAVLESSNGRLDGLSSREDGSDRSSATEEKTSGKALSAGETDDGSGKALSAGETDDGSGKAPVAGEAEDVSGEARAAGVGNSTSEMCYVYVCGAVNAPGVYELPTGSRVYEAIAMAGGMTGEADGRSLNQAAQVADGQQITVYTKEEAEKLPKNGSGAGTAEQSAGSGEDLSAGGTGKAKVNINTAGREELMTLHGIGAARADAILAYREKHGSFSRIEDIMNVEGIKEKAFAKIRDDIVV
ncbi:MULTISPECIES: helix-hairpin-helix domain-containing protein [unclassified Bilifractor]|uniref:helix-hairpin-helix domain-containing protein n=1 Tax=unclassified Bilifractor TaxID=2815795 RepID=UPI003F8FCC5E